MAIAPIDLQTLFTQLDKVGKTHVTQKEGQPLHQAIQAVQLQKKTEEQINQVNETQDTGEGTEKVNDHNRRQQERNDKERQQEEDLQKEEEKKKIMDLSDPTLGKKIDISL